MITDAQEANVSNARAKSAQDKRFPHVINIEDGRLMPNVAALRKHKLYRVYQGPKDAPLPERMRWLRGAAMRLPEVVDSTAEAFDLGKATKDEIIAFAASGEAGFTMMFDPTADIKVLRREFMNLYKAAQKATEQAQNDIDMT